ncbi:MAG TPA: sugar ABC transporter ATP-binding protein [Solirubrobacterales bacterium]|nr:sugar ABC transporter ATP-binding protein [Solirubrobacterales bacterium]
MLNGSAKDGAGGAGAAPVLEARGLVKEFPGVRALDGAALRCRAGEVRALVGENGAGKSTIVRILTGNDRPDAGELLLDGEPVTLGDPREALARGITAVYQELTVLPAMSVLDNVMLGQEPTRRGTLRSGERRRRAREALARVGLGDLDLGTRTERLSLANRQLVEIARALARGARVLILDEPTAVLAGEPLEAIHEIVRALAAEGVAVLYISHLLEEVMELADEITVLRDGAVVSAGAAREYDVPRLVREMVGRDVEAVFPDPGRPREEVAMSVTDLRPAGIDGPGLDLELHAGEIVGLAGLLGSGRSRLLRTLAGDLGRRSGGVAVGGKSVRASLHAAIDAGLVLVPEERKTDGLALGLPVRANVTLASIGKVARGGWIDRRRERAAYEEEREALGIRAAGPEQRTGELSGGNQQKVVLAKWLRTRPRVLLLDEPTRGIDVGAKAEIYELIRRLAGDGMAVVFASSDLPEVVGLSQRVLVCREGSVVGELRGTDVEPEAIMHLALGTEEAAA